MEREADGAQTVAKVKNWFHALDIESYLSEWERQVLHTPVGQLSRRDEINASWLSEGLVVLAWALGKSSLPSFDAQCNPGEMAATLDFLLPKESTALNHPILLSTVDLEDYNNFIYNLHWRVRRFSLNRQPYDFKSLAQKAWGEPVARHGVAFAEDDLALNGVPLAKTEETAWRTLESIVRERHRASNWLIGYASEDFYEVTTDT